jgi:glucosamine--fructose-6-phosphate aminotransferase (isomerizing)
MCGIIGYIGQKQVLPILIDGLRRLEYQISWTHLPV